ncbi:hypothetical protein ACL02T_09600 [Pseudonocardia sp. RS010]|uniref:hypothetical protein n=1 Tax=Pseudonocardia sp. RS010 TaxID=3385979 RepID=UPI0039A17391
MATLAERLTLQAAAPELSAWRYLRPAPDAPELRHTTAALEVAAERERTLGIDGPQRGLDFGLEP